MGLQDGTRVRDECAASVVRSSPPRPKWALFYGDGEVVEDDCSGKFVDVTIRVPLRWWEAPRDGVQFVAELLDNGKYRVLGGKDLYHVTKGEGINATDEVHTFLRSLGILKHGLSLPDGAWRAAQETVNRWRKRRESE